MYYPSSENKGADQLRGYREANLRFDFAYADCWFSHEAAHLTIFTGGISASAIIGFSRGCLVTSMATVTINLLDISQFSTGFGLTFGLVGLITTVTGPLFGKNRT